MSSRYRLTSPPAQVAAHFGHPVEMDFPPRYNIAPTQPVAVVRLDHARRRELALVRWGLIPPWVKDPATFATLVSARTETAADKPSFRGALRHRRCLIPADGYYEWTGPRGRRQIWLVRRRGGGLLGLGGLWEHWLGADGSELETMAILTVAASPDVSALNDRMPAVIPEADFETWLDTSPGTATPVLGLLKPAEAGLLEAVEVDSRLNDPRYEPAEDPIDVVEN